MIKSTGFDPLDFAAIMEEHIFGYTEYSSFEETFKDIEILLELAEEQERNDQEA